MRKEKKKGFFVLPHFYLNHCVHVLPYYTRAPVKDQVPTLLLLFKIRTRAAPATESLHEARDGDRQTWEQKERRASVVNPWRHDSTQAMLSVGAEYLPSNAIWAWFTPGLQ